MMRESDFTSQTLMLAFSIFLLLGITIPAVAELPDKQSPKRVNLEKIPRTIVKEPTYQTKSPGYCLLVFGLKAKTRVWLVIDGEIAYVDRNGNGDLTDAGERVEEKRDDWFQLGDIAVKDCNTTHQDLRIKVMGAGSFELELQSAGDLCRHVGRVESVRPVLSAKPATAPVIHPDGPITLAPYTPINFAFRSADERRDTQFEWLNLVAGSPGLGPGTFTVIYELCDLCGREAKVLADIEFPSRTSDAPPIISKQVLMTKG